MPQETVMPDDVRPSPRHASPRLVRPTSAVAGTRAARSKPWIALTLHGLKVQFEDDLALIRWTGMVPGVRAVSRDGEHWKQYDGFRSNIDHGSDPMTAWEDAPAFVLPPQPRADRRW
jgi:hypothetical protein